MANQPRFYNNGLFHIYNRGVEKRSIFIDDRDRFRFVHNLYEFNDDRAVLNFSFHYRGLTSIVERRPRKRLVDILAYVLMPTHFHLIVQQKQDAGISLFLKKLGSGYTLYFNKRHERNGVLFQGTYKAKHVPADRYLRHLMLYIHANPRSLMESPSDLLRYRWSSYPDYCGIRNFPSIINAARANDLGLSVGKGNIKILEDWIENSVEREAGLKDRGLLF